MEVVEAELDGADGIVTLFVRRVGGVAQNARPEPLAAPQATAGPARGAVAAAAAAAAAAVGLGRGRAPRFAVGRSRPFLVRWRRHGNRTSAAGLSLSSLSSCSVFAFAVQHDEQRHRRNPPTTRTLFFFFASTKQKKTNWTGIYLAKRRRRGPGRRFFFFKMEDDTETERRPIDVTGRRVRRRSTGRSRPRKGRHHPPARR